MWFYVVVFMYWNMQIVLVFKKALVACLLCFTLISCVNKTKSETATLIVEKEFNFGKINSNDTIKHIFKIQNISDVELKISKIGTSCGCTAAIVSDSIVASKQFAEIEVRFIPSKEKYNQKINNSIVVEANTNPIYTTLYLEGEVMANDTISIE